LPKLEVVLKARRKQVKYLDFIAVKTIEYIKAVTQNELLGIVSSPLIFDDIKKVFDDKNKSMIEQISETIKNAKTSWEESHLKEKDQQLTRSLNEKKSYREAEIKHIIYDSEQLMIKGTMNSIYGLSGDEHSSMYFFSVHSSQRPLPIGYYYPEVAVSVTRMGRYLINLNRETIVKKWNRANGYDTDTSIIGGDTDSVFVRTEYKDVAKVRIRSLGPLLIQVPHRQRN